MTATILVADRATLERLSLEGGLRSSFLGVFEGSLFETADDTPRGDGIGLDDLLEARRIVCVDGALLAPIDESAPDRVERERYRYNFIRKVAAREHVWLKVLDGGEAAQKEGLESIRSMIAEASQAFGPGSPRLAVVVLVFTEPMSADSAKAIAALRDEQPGISRIYVMAHRLQPAERGSRAVSSHAVWPICVARLLAARSLMASGTAAPPPDKAKIMSWRTIQWAGARASSWRPIYAAMVRRCLLPSSDPEGERVDAEKQQGFGAPEGLVDPAAPTKGIRDFEWPVPADDLHQAGLASLGDPVFEELLRASGERSLGGRALKSGIERIDAVDRKAANDWGKVADPQEGLSWLRRLRDRRLWRTEDVGVRLEGQRKAWGTLIAQRRALDVAREHHRDAVEEVAVARSRHLSLLWRLLIAAVVMLFLGQFFASFLVPLRPDEAPVPAQAERTFLGAPLKQDESVAFLVDCSGSMAGERIDSLRSELRASVIGLKEGTPFTIVTFRGETRDEMCLPGGEHGLVEWKRDMEGALDQFIKDQVTPYGGTNPAGGLERIFAMNPEPKTIILMTDGLFADRESVRQAIISLEARQKASNGPIPKIHTVALWQRDEEPFLRAISQRTGGEYTFKGFDPFRPLTFAQVITIVLAATALGVAVGAFLPHWLEVWRGRKGVSAVRASMTGLIREFCHLTVDTQRMLRGAFESRLSHRVNSVAYRQSALAGRALDAVERSISSVRDQQGAGPGSSVRTGGALAGEDRRDLSRGLDADIASVNADIATGELEERLGSSASDHAEEIRKCWVRMCRDFDLYRSGHLPSWKISEELRRLLDRQWDRSAMEFLYSRCSANANGLGVHEHRDACVDGIVGLLQSRADAVPGFLSARVYAIDGKVPRAHSAWFWMEPEGRGAEDAASLVHSVATAVDQRIGNGAPASRREPDLGLACLGLLHEELEVDLPSGGIAPDAPDHDFVVRCRP